MNSHIFELEARALWLRRVGRTARYITLLAYVVVMFVALSVARQLPSGIPPITINEYQFIYVVLAPLITTLAFIPVFAVGELLIWAGNQAESNAYQLRLLYTLAKANVPTSQAPEPPTEKNIWKPTAKRRFPAGRNRVE